MKLRATRLLHNQIFEPGCSIHELGTPKADEAEGNETPTQPLFDPGRSHHELKMKLRATTMIHFQIFHPGRAHHELRMPKADGAESNTNDTLPDF